MEIYKPLLRLLKIFLLTFIFLLGLECILLLYLDSSLIFDLYTKVLTYIRDNFNFLLDEQIIEHKDNYEAVSINNEKWINDTNVYNNSKWWFSLITISLAVGIVSGIVIYYYPDISNYFKDFTNDSDIENKSDLLGSLSSSNSSMNNSPVSETGSEYFKDLSELTPRASSSKLE